MKPLKINLNNCLASFMWPTQGNELINRQNRRRSHDQTGQRVAMAWYPNVMDFIQTQNFQKPKVTLSVSSPSIHGVLVWTRVYFGPVLVFIVEISHEW